jgi:hypothetical protein
MHIERDEDTFEAIREVAVGIDLGSRNYNDELIAIHYYKKLDVLTAPELEQLIELWQHKSHICYKEMLASRWMVIQIILLLSLVMYIAWLSGGRYAAVGAGVFCVSGMIAMIEDKRVSIAKRNYRDALLVRRHLEHFKDKHTK